GDRRDLADDADGVRVVLHARAADGETMSSAPRSSGARRLSPGRIAQWVAIGFALFWSLAPIYWMLSTSFKTELEATRLVPTLWPEAPTVANYVGLAGTSLPF